MYTKSIIWFLVWPVLIYISYRLVLFVLKKYEARQVTETDTAEKTE